MRKPYDTDLTDEQWKEIAPHVESPKGRRASVDRREIVNAILYVARTGCQWRNLPNDLPNWSTVYSCFHRWTWNGVLDNLYTSLHKEVRVMHGKKETPTVGIVDSQSVKVPAKGGPRVCYNGVLTGQRASMGAKDSL